MSNWKINFRGTLRKCWDLIMKSTQFFQVVAPPSCTTPSPTRSRSTALHHVQLHREQHDRPWRHKIGNSGGWRDRLHGVRVRHPIHGSRQGPLQGQARTDFPFQHLLLQDVPGSFFHSESSPESLEGNSFRWCFTKPKGSFFWVWTVQLQIRLAKKFRAPCQHSSPRKEGLHLRQLRQGLHQQAQPAQTLRQQPRERVLLGRREGHQVSALLLLDQCQQVHAATYPRTSQQRSHASQVRGLRITWTSLSPSHTRTINLVLNKFCKTMIFEVQKRKK